MVEPDLISPVEHHLVAPRFGGRLCEHKAPCQHWQANSVRGHLDHIRRHDGAFELFLRSNSTALHAANDRTSFALNDDSARCDFPWIQNFLEISGVGTNFFNPRVTRAHQREVGDSYGITRVWPTVSF
jgi:hypothetical protein